MAIYGSIVYPVHSKELQDILAEKMVNYEEQRELRCAERMAKFGDKYEEIFKTTAIVLPTPGNQQEYHVETTVPICYLCRALLAPVVTGEYIGVSALKYWEFDNLTYNDDFLYSKMHKPHYACFDCKKVWKPTERSDAYTDHFKAIVMLTPANTRCSTCRKPGTYMGLNFRAPKKTDTKGWRLAEKAVASNPALFEAKCKCHLM